MNNLMPWIIASVIVTVCLVMIWVAVKYAASLNPSRRSAQSRLTIVASQAIGSRERVVVLRYQANDYVLGVTPSHIQLIDTHKADAQQDGQTAIISSSSE